MIPVPPRGVIPRGVVPSSRGVFVPLLSKDARLVPGGDAGVTWLGGEEG